MPPWRSKISPIPHSYAFPVDVSGPLSTLNPRRRLDSTQSYYGIWIIIETGGDIKARCEPRLQAATVDELGGMAKAIKWLYDRVHYEDDETVMGGVLLRDLRHAYYQIMDFLFGKYSAVRQTRDR